MDGFLNDLLKASQQELFDHLTRMEAPSSNTSRSLPTECVVPSTNIGLPRHLLPSRRSWPAYTTYTAPVVKMLVEQDERRTRPASTPSEKTDPEPQTERESQDSASEEGIRVLWKRSGSGCASGTQKTSVAASEAESSLPLPRACSRVIFARKPSSYSSLARSSRKK